MVSVANGSGGVQLIYVCSDMSSVANGSAGVQRIYVCSDMSSVANRSAGVQRIYVCSSMPPVANGSAGVQRISIDGFDFCLPIGHYCWRGQPSVQHIRKADQLYRHRTRSLG